jgi:isopentenyl-diphosphate delta-isomerase
MPEYVQLVNKKDEEVGIEEKIKTHREGKLHRAFSIFVFNSKGELLLQKRAGTKYHSAGLWSNTCCSHPLPGEPLEKAVHRRLKEEMGFDCKLKEIFSFIYKAKLGNNIFEHEYDHVFLGKFDGEPKPNPEEVSEWRWVSLEKLKKDVEENPEKYTYWFRACLDRIISSL